MKPEASARITRWQLGLAALGLVSAIAWIAHAIHVDPNVVFLTRTGDPRWITPRSSIDTDGIRVDASDAPVVSFVRRFVLEEVPAAATLQLRAVGHGRVLLNETEVWRSEPQSREPSWKSSWKRSQVVRLSRELLAGDNEVRVEVANLRGPALLQLRIADLQDRILVETDPTWRAIGADGRVLETERAVDTRPNPESFTLPATASLLVDHAPVLVLLFALGAMLAFALARSLGSRARAHAPEAVLGAATLFWIAVYAFKSTSLPVVMGFDINGHLAYIDFLLERRALPVATDGQSMYHPPLAHALIAGLVAIFDLAREGAAARWLYRLPGFLAGLANVWLVWLTAKKLFRDDPLRTSLAIAFAALLPMNLYSSAYVSNEPLHAALVSAALSISCGLLIAGGAPPLRVAALAATLGLAILTKFTALLCVPLVAGFIALKARAVDELTWPRAIARGAALASGVAVVGGWFYLRSWMHLGRPVVGNWDLAGSAWWEQPGFHTADYYTSFGQALSHPYFAGYASFWDGVYSTFWADGLVSGMLRIATRHDAWNWEWMTLGGWLAFPATLLLVAGAVRAASLCLRERDPGRRLAMSLLVAFGGTAFFALLAITFRLPYYAQAKAFYVLCAIVPLSVFAGLGLSWPLEQLRERAAPIRFIYWGWLGTLAGSLVLAFLG